jgi:transposase
MVTSTRPSDDSTEFAPLPTTREERGRQIARLGGIRPLGARYAVPSQSIQADAPTYLVDLVEQTCTCPDYELRRKPCKHYEACMFWLAWEGSVNEDTGRIELPAPTPAPRPKRRTYPRNWPAYNAAQIEEKARVELLLKALCEGIEQPARPAGTRGRHAYSRRDAIFGCVMKVYTTLSGRRADTDLQACAARGSLGRAYHPNTLFRAMEDPATTAILVRLIEASAAPLAEVENRAGQFAQDSTGISTVTYDRWFDQKHGKLRAEHAWLKLHVMVGTLTHVVTGAKVSDEADCPVLPELLHQTARTFQVREVSADKAYLSKKNLAAIDRVGAVPFIPFKSNSVGMASKSEHWRRMWCHFSLKSEDFRARYHRRSNVETAMHMIKSKFGAAVRSRLPVAQVNEILAKLVCHNLACIVHAVREFGIDVDLDGPAAAPAAPAAPASPVQS